MWIAILLLAAVGILAAMVYLCRPMRTAPPQAEARRCTVIHDRFNGRHRGKGNG